MSDSRESQGSSAPKLSVVDDPPPQPAEPPRKRRSGLLTWLFAVTTLVFAWLYLNQLEHTQQGELHIAELESDLLGAHADLRAEQARMDQVRGGIDQLATDLQSLRSLTTPPPEGAGVE